ncbi:hypothetical protein CL634_05975 [bacterium]|nr:hypothetical protein [bacterium]
MNIKYTEIPIGFESDTLLESSRAGLYYAYDDDCTDWVTTELKRGEVFGLRDFVLMNLICPEGRILDVGANIGTFSLVAGLTEKYDVIAIEASPQSTQIYQAAIDKNKLDNDRPNGFTNIKLVNALVSNVEELVEFLDNGKDSARAATDADRGEECIISLESRTIADILEESQWDTVDFIKMDIEGYEVKAFEGMEEFLVKDDAPAILFEVNAYTLGLYDETPNSLMRTLEKYGYFCFTNEGISLVPSNSFEPIPTCHDDFLAVKERHLALLKEVGFQFSLPYTYDQRIEKISESIKESVPECLEYWLKFASEFPFILGEERVKKEFENAVGRSENEKFKDAVPELLDKKRESTRSQLRYLS